MIFVQLELQFIPSAVVLDKKKKFPRVILKL